MFIDIGANIGVFILDLARRKNSYAIGFEPNYNCVTALKKSMKINGMDNYQIHNCVVGDKEMIVSFNPQNNSQGASVHTSKLSPNAIKQICLDKLPELQSAAGKDVVIMLIDAELRSKGNGRSQSIFKGQETDYSFEYNCE